MYRHCLGFSPTTGRVSTSLFLYNSSEVANSRTLRQAQACSGSYPVHSSGEVLVGTGFVRNTTFRVWSLTTPVGPRDTNARRVLAFASFEPLQALDTVFRAHKSLDLFRGQTADAVLSCSQPIIRASTPEQYPTPPSFTQETAASTAVERDTCCQNSSPSFSCILTETPLQVP